MSQNCVERSTVSHSEALRVMLPPSTFMDPCIFPVGDKAPQKGFSDPERLFPILAGYCLPDGASSVSSAGYPICPHEVSVAVT